MEPARDRIFSRSFSLAIVANLFSFTSMYLLLATLPLYVLAIGGSVSDAGIVLACFTLTAVVLRPWIGRLSDRRAKKGIMLAGAVITAVSSLLYEPSHTVPLLMAVRVLHGVGWAAFGTAASALAADLAPLPRRGEAMGYFGVGMNVAMAIGPALGVFLVGQTGYGSPVPDSHGAVRRSSIDDRRHRRAGAGAPPRNAPARLAELHPPLSPLPRRGAVHQRADLRRGGRPAPALRRGREARQSGSLLHRLLRGRAGHPRPPRAGVGPARASGRHRAGSAVHLRRAARALAGGEHDHAARRRRALRDRRRRRPAGDHGD